MMKCLDLVGVFFIFFIKPGLKDKIKGFESSIIKTGLMGTLGNKGSCLIRFSYLDTSFAFSCGHFAAGGSSNSSRLNEMTEILSKNTEHCKNLTFKDHNIWFLFGDLNFRIDIDINTCLTLIMSRNLKELKSFDQFNKSKEVDFKFSGLHEGELNFNPTYKYAKNSTDYDTKNKRVPSWCDRIFFKKSSLIEQLAYDRAEYLCSDHRPVFGIFRVFPFKVIKEEKSKMYQEIKQNLAFGINPNRESIFHFEDNKSNENNIEEENINECRNANEEEKLDYVQLDKVDSHDSQLNEDHLKFFK